MCCDNQFQISYDKYFKIIYSASTRYGTNLTSSEREQCGRIGLWKALEEFDNTKSQLSSFIYNKVKYECLQERRNLAHQTRDLMCSGLMEENEDHKTYIVATNNENLDDPFLDMRLRRGFTFKEMGKALGVSLDVARNRYLQAVNACEITQ